MNNKFVAIALAVLSFAIHALAQGPVTTPWITLVSTETYNTGTPGSGDLGNFGISLNITAESADLYLRKAYTNFANYHSGVLRLNGVAISTPVTSRAYVVSPLSRPADTDNYYAILEGETRNFQFVLADVLPPESGFYRWGLVELEVADSGNPTEASYVSLDETVYHTNYIALNTQNVPEPTSLALLGLGLPFLLSRRRRRQ